MIVLGDLNHHHKDWQTYSSKTDRPDECCCNFSISNDLTQKVNFPTKVSGCDFHSPAFLDLYISSDTNTCSAMAFLSLGNLDHVVLVSNDFPSNSKGDVLFDGVAYADWDSLSNHLRDVPREDIFIL